MTYSADINKEYALSHLEESDLNPNPLVQFQIWLDEAIASGITDANIMSLATVDKAGRVSVRMISCQAIDDQNFKFVTNYNTDKSKALLDHNQASILFWWPALERQVQISVIAQKMSDIESDEFFAKQDQESQLAIILSKQSQILVDKKSFINEYTQKRDEPATDLPPKRPEYWGGFLLKPTQFEFWQGGLHHLHDRLRYKQSETIDNSWDIVRLYP